MKKLIDGISAWIKEKVKEAGKEGVVLGLSGGLDSTVTALLCKSALGAKRVLGLIMPCHSEKEDIEDAKLCVEFLQIPSKYIDLSPIFDTFLSILPQDSRIAETNLKARLRMVTLYYFANQYKYLVVGTSNKSELLVGYFTKYGDGGADILPLGDLYKTDVRKLATYINIPERIISKPPSAGLWKGQTDEGELGITYQKLDKTLLKLVDEKKMADTPQEQMVQKMIEQSCHKRAFPPIYPVRKNFSQQDLH